MTGESIEELQTELSKLRQENNDLKRIFRDIPDTYYRTDLDGRIIMVSPSAKTLIGCPIKDLIGQQITDYYIHPEDRVVFLEKLAASGGVIRDHEHQIRRANGEIIWLSTNAQYIHDNEKNIIGVEGMIRNITERKALEEKIFDTEKYQALCGLIGGIAHYFNNDLTAITGSLYLLGTKMEQSHTGQQHLEQANNKIFHISTIIQNLLTFSKHSITPTHMKKRNISSLLKQTVARFEATLDEPLNVHLAISDYEINIACDTERMTLALMNLLDNAKHAVTGLSDTTIEVKLHIIAFPEKLEYVDISIVDSGCGMDEKVLMHAKEPFFTTREVGQGKGLGLSVTSGIIEQHEGKMVIQSTLGKGTEVHIRLPVQRTHSNQGLEA